MILVGTPNTGLSVPSWLCGYLGILRQQDISVKYGLIDLLFNSVMLNVRL